MIDHKLKIEKLYHFECGECFRWWTVKTYQNPLKRKFCPYCGYYGIAKPKDKKDVNDTNVVDMG